VQEIPFHLTMKGGECMSEFFLSLITVAVKAFVKTFVAAHTKRMLSRKKERTAPLPRDGSDEAEV
jgi:hypothetical protein